jgi:hypothetical protein
MHRSPAMQVWGHSLHVLYWKIHKEMLCKHYGKKIIKTSHRKGQMKIRGNFGRLKETYQERGVSVCQQPADHSHLGSS